VSGAADTLVSPLRTTSSARLRPLSHSARQPVSDYRRLCFADAASAAGSGVGAGALPLVALLLLHASAAEVSLLAVLSGAASAMIALPFASSIEYLHKRPVMISADCARFAALASVPIASCMGVLTFVQLCAVAVVQVVATLAFSAAGTAHLKGLVAEEMRLRANRTFATTMWLSQTAGPAVGGLLISALGATVTLVVDAISYLASAIGIRSLRSSEPSPPTRDETASRRAEITAGWRYIAADHDLRHLLANAMLFGGCVMATSSLFAVFVLRTLHLTALDYGLALGIPCLGGLIGSRLTVPLCARFGQRRVLLCAGVARTPWMLLLPLAPVGRGGLIVILVAETGLLLSAGVFNPCFATYRMTATGDEFVSRVASAWSITAKIVQPLFIAVGGAVCALCGIRVMMLGAGCVSCASAVLLPWGAALGTSRVRALRFASSAD
jgi:Na+/melibiose symporter-like transporter